MNAYEAVSGAIREAKTETEEGEQWSDDARRTWIGYVSALRQLGVLSSSEYTRLVRDDLEASDDEKEYGMYAKETNLAGAEDLVDLRRRESAPA